MNVLETAIKLYDAGWCVLPIIHGSKAPTVPWLGLQRERATEDETRLWFAGQDVGLGVICGQVSGGLYVLDFDDAEAYGDWARANPDWAVQLPTATTGRGFHVFCCSDGVMESGRFRMPGSTKDAGDILAEKKLCVLPPTRHPNGTRAWLTEPDGQPPTVTLADLGVCRSGPAHVSTKEGGPVEAVLEGGRHQYLLSVAGRLRNEGLGQDALRASLEAVNRERCSPPLPLQEVQSVADWAARAEAHSLRGYFWEEQGDGPSFLTTATPKGNEQDDDRFGGMFLPLGQYLTQTNAAEIEWLVEDFLPVGYLVVVGGTSKAGKTCLLTSLALHVADGQDFLGMATSQSPVLWCALEETETERRIALECYDGQPDALWTSHAKVNIDQADGIAALRYWVRKTGAKLLVIDPLYGAHSADNLTDGTSARRVLQPLKDLCREERLTALVIHHLNKAVSVGMTRERMADSNQILAAASMDILIDSSESADGARELRLQCRGRGDFANQTWVVKSPQMGEYVLMRHGKGVDKGSEATDAAILDALSSLGSGTAEVVAQETGHPLGTVRNRLTALGRVGSVTIAGKDGRSNVYRAA